ncbi:MAG TPA: maleylpyruvate isomerase family mycothiol-dependent enzyme, partial [Acidimicrobiales bacterium]|nr:maleylpyruvate isomerase family mycothiol-dependent enzyme [Acidimicrobiales bacterium]
PGATVLEEFRSVTARRLADLRSWPTARFDEPGPSPVGVVPYREFMAVRVMDSWVHEQDMRVATGRPGHDHGPAAELSLGRLVSAMPFVVGKQARAPEGSSVRFELAGPLARRLDVAVRQGRAAVVDDLGGPPSATVRLDTEVFWRLACGRVTGAAARHAGLVAIEGDAALGASVVDAMAFMI